MVTPTRPKFVVPLSYIFLDIGGVVLVGLGSANVLGKNVIPLQTAYFVEVGWLLIVIGFFCMLPIMLFVLTAIRHTQQQDALWYEQLPPQFKAKLEAKIHESRK